MSDVAATMPAAVVAAPARCQWVATALANRPVEASVVAVEKNRWDRWKAVENMGWTWKKNMVKPLKKCGENIRNLSPTQKSWLEESRVMVQVTVFYSFLIVSDTKSGSKWSKSVNDVLNYVSVRLIFQETRQYHKLASTIGSGHWITT